MRIFPKRAPGLAFVLLLGLFASHASAQDQLPIPIDVFPPKPEDWSKYLQIPPDEAAKHLRNRVPPKYPPIARAAGIEGTVVLSILIGADGCVTDARTLSGPPLLFRSALETARHWEYEPFTQNGTAVPVVTTIEIPYSVTRIVLFPAIPFPAIGPSDSVTLSLDRGFYSLKVLRDGSVTYKGENYVSIPGEHRTSISKEDFESLVSAFKSANFYSCPEDYGPFQTDTVPTTLGITVNGSAKIVRFYIDKSGALDSIASKIDEITNVRQWTIGDSGTVSRLLAEGVDLNAVQPDGQTLLLSSSLFGSPVLVSDLLRAGANPNVSAHNHWTPLAYAAYRGSPEMVSALLAAHADAHAETSNGSSVLMLAAASGRPDVVRLILSAKVDINFRSPQNETALMLGAYSGVPEVVALLLHAGAHVKDHSKNHMTALLAATQASEPSTEGVSMGLRPDDTESWDAREARENRGEVVRMLVRAGADVNVRNKDGETALFTLDDDDAARALLDAKIQVDAKNIDGQTALAHTVSDSLAEILIKAGADVNTRDNAGATPLMQAAENNYVGILKLLVGAGASIDLQDRNGWTALMYAADAGLPDCVNELLKAHADFDIRNSSGLTALTLAKMGGIHPLYQKHGYPQVILQLENAGAKE